MNNPQLDLVIPKQEITRSAIINSTPKAVEKELRGLPLGNIPEALKQCTAMLSLLNRTRISLPDRKGIMLNFDYYYGVFESYYRPGTSIKHLRPKNANETRQLMELREELANGYKACLLDTLSTNKGGREMAMMIYMAMYYQAHCLLHCYEHFQQQPLHIWSEINQLYWLAESRHLHQVTVGKVFEPVTANTIGDLYKQILLLECANPYHLNSGEPWVLYHYLGHWSKYVMLDHNYREEDTNNFFMVDIRKADKPFSNHSHQPSSSADIRIINSNKLLSLAEQHINTLSSGSSSTSVGMPPSINSEHAAELLEQAYKNWAQVSTRQNLRLPINAMAGLVWGIHSIHNQLSPTKLENTQVNNKTAGKIINESHGGFCLQLNKADQQDFFNGQVVAIRSDRQAHPRWVLGIIRWQQTLTDMQKIVGVEYIRGAVRPIKLKTLDNPGPTDNYRTGLLVTQKNNGHQQHSVLASCGLYNTGRELNLDVPQQGRQYDVRASELLTRTALVDRFSFKAA